MTDFKKSKATNTTETKNIKEMANRTGNMYEAVAIMSKRAVQINKEIKEELLSKLAEFATPSESIEEIFENSEQIEVSKFYERLPKGTLIAVQEFLEENDEAAVKRPKHCGLYILAPISVEFWQERDNRTHERIKYFLNDHTWDSCLLSP